MIRAIKSSPKIGDILELKDFCCGSKWRMRLKSFTEGGFIGVLISSNYPGDNRNIGEDYLYEQLRDYILVK